MATLNRVLLVGNLTRAPHMRCTRAGEPVCKFGIALHRRVRQAVGEGYEEEVCFVEIDIVGRQAESCGNNLRKGSLVLVEGRLRQDSWHDRRTKSERTRLAVTAERIQFLDNLAVDVPAAEH
jgi:single-strand DNA-binding protein